MKKNEEIFKVGQEIISVEYETEEIVEYTWFFGGYLNNTTIVINVVSEKSSSQFFIRLKIGDTITLPELIFDDIANLQYEVVDLIPEENKIVLLEK
ncbi:hypothetical protein CIB95_00915 [Lottiidibacillus patelloidae]|uniref:Uncharacterized protein n=1 Tax=Lottiidibacillus patelloidae TaxID=2670334 RepID=A0A263BWX7_9BACI|nr:hypothetical protein [Lottiidibacillus patelloidae]OZM58170.1 hypothetical protein CIB95_00915 [Lottiidibacillus patelloidae]